MKKTIVYILTVLALILALSGCGMTAEDNALQVTPRPQITVKPEMTAMPEVNDGVVNDDDGVISKDDNGPMETKAPATMKPQQTTAPKVSASPNP